MSRAIWRHVTGTAPSAIACAGGSREGRSGSTGGAPVDLVPRRGMPIASAMACSSSDESASKWDQRSARPRRWPADASRRRRRSAAGPGPVAADRDGLVPPASAEAPRFVHLLQFVGRGGARPGQLHRRSDGGEDSGVGFGSAGAVRASPGPSRVGSQRHVSVLALGQVLALGGQDVEAAAEDGAGVGRGDDVVDVAALGRDVGVGVALGVLLDQLGRGAAPGRPPRPARGGRRSPPRPSAP